VEGQVPCTGAVLRVDPADGSAQVHAWGFSDPKALAFTPDGRLLVADDPPPTGAVLWAAVPGVWYGWPDYLGQVASADPQLAVHPNPPPPPVATLKNDVGGLAVASDPAYGGPAQVFVAQPDGTVAFTTLDSGVTVPFAANLQWPAAVAFAPGGQALWVADSGTGMLWRIVAMPGADLPAPGEAGFR
jgi:sugar lactone lactonase YvrE